MESWTACPTQKSAAPRSGKASALSAFYRDTEDHTKGTVLTLWNQVLGLPSDKELFCHLWVVMPFAAQLHSLWTSSTCALPNEPFVLSRFVCGLQCVLLRASMSRLY